MVAPHSSRGRGSVWVRGVVLAGLSLLPDADVIGFRLGDGEFQRPVERTDHQNRASERTAAGSRTGSSEVTGPSTLTYRYGDDSVCATSDTRTPS